MKLSKTTAMVLIVVVVGLVATLLAGPPDVRAQVLAGLGGVGALLLSTLAPLIRRDTDGNGVADWIERLLERVFGVGGGPPPPGAGAVLLLLAAGLVSFCQGCGGTPREQHATLNTVTDVADPTYEMALAGCDDARNAIIARAGTTYAQDRYAMDRIHAVCDAIVEGFEALRGTQITARAYIDRGVADAATAAVAEGLVAWGHLRALIARIATLGDEALEAVDGNGVDPETPPPVVTGTAGGEEASQ